MLRSTKALLNGQTTDLPLTSEEIKECLEAFGALWVYNSKPNASRPHVKLASGLHSDGYANVGGLLKNNPLVRQAMALTIIDKIRDQYASRYIRSVVGADTSSTLLAKDVANLLGVRHFVMKKKDDEKGKRQEWDSSNPPLIKDTAHILQVEDLITTGMSSEQVREGIRLAHPNLKIHFYGRLPVIVDRSDPDKRVGAVEDSKILPLLSLDIKNYEPNNCPYCEAGSPVVENVKDNWEKLTGRAAN